VFADVSEPCLEYLDACKTVRQYKPGEIIFREKTLISGVYCVRSGKVKLYKSGEHGKRQLLNIATSGAVLGTSALFSDVPHVVSAEVIEGTEVCFFPKEGFLAALKQSPSIAINLLARLSGELNRAEEQVFDLAYKSIRVRFAELLLTLRKNFGTDEEGACRLQISLSRAELAQAIGTTLESAVRLLSEFRREGIVEIENKQVIIREIDKLKKFTTSSY